MKYAKAKRRRNIVSAEDVTLFENQSPKCSSKYVPIKTSEFMKALTGFKFVSGGQYRGGSSAHYVKMSRGDDINLHIENSFDRSMSLRLSFDYQGFTFGRIKQVHMGEPAKDIIGSKEQINMWYKNASATIDSMRILQLSKPEMEKIAEIALKVRGINYKSVQGISYNHPNILEFVTTLVDNIKNGGYMRKAPSGELKEIKPVKREALMVKMNFKIWDYLEKNNPELYL